MRIFLKESNESMSSGKEWGYSLGKGEDIFGRINEDFSLGKE